MTSDKQNVAVPPLRLKSTNDIDGYTGASKACAHDRTTDEIRGPPTTDGNPIQMIYAASLLCHRLRASRLRRPYYQAWPAVRFDTPGS